MSSLRIPIKGAYPQREIPEENKLDALARRLVGVLKRRVDRSAAEMNRVTAAVRRHAAGFEAMSRPELDAAVQRLAAAMQADGLDDALVLECFALVRELSGRVLGKRHFDVQVFAGWVLLHGSIAEMQTGEGKTLTATLAVGTAALAGIPAHVVSVNDYLVERDAEQLRPLYEALGLSVGTIVEGMSPAERRGAYACDVTYCTNKELVFDYLKDRIALTRETGAARLQLQRFCAGAGRVAEPLMRGLHFAVIDEADSVLVDEARVPVIISRTVDNPEQNAFYLEVSELACGLERDLDYLVDRRERKVFLTDGGRARIDAYAADRDGIWSLTDWREEGVIQALVAKELFIRDQHYLVEDDKVKIVDEFTGRTMADRSWEMGLHQLVEAKEGLPLTGQREPLAKISYQRFFRRYLRLGGMSGTVAEIAPELWNVYELHTVKIPTHRPCRRRLLPDRLFVSEAHKLAAIVTRAAELHAAQRPVLIGTRSVAISEVISERLAEAGLPHRVLNARQDATEAEIVARAGEAGAITVATNMAGRGTDIALADIARAAGGLHVLASERHEAGRIDRQLFGRAARQGDPGSCECMLSLEDALVSEHAPRWLRLLARAMASGDGRLPAWSGQRLFTATQRRVERQHSRIRRDLLDMDEKHNNLLAFAGVQE